MTTEHVIVPREELEKLLSRWKKSIHDYVDTDFEAGYDQSTKHHIYAVEQILYRATPSESELAIHMDRDAWRAAMIGLCQGSMQDVGTPDKAADHLRKRLAKAKPSAPRVVKWGIPDNVGELVAQLRTLDPSEPIHAAYFIEVNGQLKAKTTGVVTSRERVVGNNIRAGDESVPYSNVIWSAQDKHAAMADAIAAIYSADEVDSVAMSVYRRSKKAYDMLRFLAQRIRAAAPQAGERG